MNVRSLEHPARDPLGGAGLSCSWLTYPPYGYLLEDLWRDRDVLEQVLQQGELAHFG
jgi:hypothetical protein